jgi:hypothetical protein
MGAIAADQQNLIHSIAKSVLKIIVHPLSQISGNLGLQCPTRADKGFEFTLFGFGCKGQNATITTS